MKIDIVAVGKIRERWLKDAIEEYKKRVSRFAALNIIEIPDSPDNLSIDRAIRIEGERLLDKIPQSGFVVALDIHGEVLDSMAFATRQQEWIERGGSKLTYIIAGSNGFAPDVLAVVDKRIALSQLTFPHQLTRLILLEQIFRGFKITHNETYHK